MLTNKLVGLGVLGALAIAIYLGINKYLKTRDSLTQALQTIDILGQELAKSQVAQINLEKDRLIIQSQRDEANKKLRDHIDRESTVAAKPKLVQRLTNKAFKRNQERLACITGNATSCDTSQ